MSAQPPPKSFDPEAEQEIDFGRYVRLLAARWWLIVAGLILGAVIGYAVSLGGSQRYQATATLYLGQPYSASGNVQLQAAQTNPSTVRQIVHATSIVDQVAAVCKTKAGTFKGGISTQTVSGNISKNGQTPLVTVSVQAAKRKVATCVANALARLVITKTSAFANQKIANFRREIVVDEKQETLINKALQTSGSSTSRPAAAAAAARDRADRPAERDAAPLAGEAGRGAVGAHRGCAEPDHCTQSSQHGGGRGDHRCDHRRACRAPLGRHRGGGAAQARDERLTMLEDKRVAVVVPAHDEEELIGTTLAGIPDFVDRIYVVDDGSRDATVERARERRRGAHRGHLARAQRGVGAAIVTGYKRATADGYDVTCVMAGDNQMDPEDLETLVDAGRTRRARLREGEPARHRRGLDADPAHALPRQRRALDADEDRVRLLARRRLAVRLHGDLAADARDARPRPRLHGLRVPERPPRAPERLERARARLPVAADLRRRRALRDPLPPRRAPHLVALVKGFFWRLREKYVIRDFHPLVFFYAFGFLRRWPASSSASSSSATGIAGNEVSVGTVVLIALLLISGSQFTLFAMWFDMESNKDLR